MFLVFQEEWMKVRALGSQYKKSELAECYVYTVEAPQVG